MAILPTAVIGDVDDYRIVPINGLVNLDNVSAVETHIWQPGIPAVTLTTAVEVSADSTIRVELGNGTGWLADTATPGDWYVEYELTFLDGSVLTWPQEKPDVMPVRAQGA